MKREIRKAVRDELHSAFWAPDPVRREHFLERFSVQMAQKESGMRAPGTGAFLFVLSQIAYIRKWIWGLSAVVFAAASFMAASHRAAGMEEYDRMLWGISSLTPILALTVIAESGRSQNYGMAELEMATRFSVRSIVLARLGILGVENLLMLAAFTAFSLRGDVGNGRKIYDVWQTGMCILLPYLLTSFVGLWIVRRVKGKEAVYICIGIAACISMTLFFAYDGLGQLYQTGNPLWWTAGTFILCIGVMKQGAGLAGRTQNVV